MIPPKHIEKTLLLQRNNTKDFKKSLEQQSRMRPKILEV